jgi:tRNA pseudouridine38-40 synthase
VPEDHRTADGPVPDERALRLTVEYSGTRFAGWQVQPEARTVQGELEKALAVVLREQVRLTGASRTDSGVHALGQVCSFTTRSTATLGRVQGGLNALLPEDVSVLDVAQVPLGWSARFAATGKRYRYRILDRRAPSPTEAATAWHVPTSLDLAAMQAAADRLVGTHDFAALASKSEDEARTTVRTIRSVRVSRQPLSPWGSEADTLPVVAIDVEGDAFLYKMVRTIAGTLVQVGRGRRPPEDVTTILASRDRRLAGPAAPAHGLFLLRVFYDDAPVSHPHERSRSEGVSCEGLGHRSPHAGPRHDPDVRDGEGREARALHGAAS